VSDKIPSSDEVAVLERALAVLEEQQAVLDSLGARVAGAHLSAAIEHLRLDLLDRRLAGKTRH
jgi:hypothetical protein